MWSDDTFLGPTVFLKNCGNHTPQNTTAVEPDLMHIHNRPVIPAPIEQTDPEKLPHILTRNPILKEPVEDRKAGGREKAGHRVVLMMGTGLDLITCFEDIFLVKCIVL